MVNLPKHGRPHVKVLQVSLVIWESVTVPRGCWGCSLKLWAVLLKLAEPMLWSSRLCVCAFVRVGLALATMHDGGWLMYCSCMLSTYTDFCLVVFVQFVGRLWLRSIMINRGLARGAILAAGSKSTTRLRIDSSHCRGLSGPGMNVKCLSLRASCVFWYLFDLKDIVQPTTQPSMVTPDAAKARLGTLCHRTISWYHRQSCMRSYVKR